MQRPILLLLRQKDLFPPSRQADLEGAVTTRVFSVGLERKQRLLGTVSIDSWWVGSPQNPTWGLLGTFYE